MDGITIAIICLLCAYPISVVGLLLMYKQKYEKRKMITWNIILLLLPAIGTLVYLPFLFIEKKKEKEDGRKNVG